MKTRNSILVLAALFAVFLMGTTAQADVSPWFVEKMVNDEATLVPGNTTYCDKDFKVQNMSEEMAEVHVILGNGANYITDRLEPNASKAYSLNGDYGFSGGWDSSRTTRIDEARIINSTGGMSDLKVICK